MGKRWKYWIPVIIIKLTYLNLVFYILQTYKIKVGDYDLVVMGSRGLGAFSRAMLGSVYNKVLNQVNANVLLIK